MKKLPALCCVIVFISLGFSEGFFKYNGYKVYKVIPKTVEEVKLLNKFEHDNNFDFWTDIRYLNIPVDVMVSPAAQQIFETSLENENMEYTTSVNDVEEIVQQDRNRRRMAKVTRGDVTFEEYMRHDEINAYLERLAREYPDIVKTEIIGRSFEGRNLTLVRISTGGSNKPTILAEAAIHAREWMAPSVALYIINQLVENPENLHMIRDVDWAILPVLNADGYEYTHTNDRFWRKTRTLGSVCDGVDANRNFDALWNTPGASIWQCDQTYAGHRVFSEAEVQAISNYILSHKEEIKLFIDIHSYGRWLLYPWGHTFEDVDNVDQLRYLGQLFNDAVHEVRGLNYTVTSFASGLYLGSGTSVDWIKTVGVDLAYTLELPFGGSGFNPPPTDIQPVVEETWEGFKAFHNYIETNFAN